MLRCCLLACWPAARPLSPAGGGCKTRVSVEEETPETERRAPRAAPLLLDGFKAVSRRRPSETARPSAEEGRGTAAPEVVVPDGVPTSVSLGCSGWISHALSAPQVRSALPTVRLRPGTPTPLLSGFPAAIVLRCTRTDATPLQLLLARHCPSPTIVTQMTAPTHLRRMPRRVPHAGIPKALLFLFGLSVLPGPVAGNHYGGYYSSHGAGTQHEGHKGTVPALNQLPSEVH